MIIMIISFTKCLLTNETSQTIATESAHIRPKPPTAIVDSHQEAPYVPQVFFLRPPPTVPRRSCRRCVCGDRRRSCSARYGTFDPIFSLRLWGTSFQAFCIARLDAAESTALLPLMPVENAEVHGTLGPSEDTGCPRLSNPRPCMSRRGT
jgi:hypothetical protein